MSVMHYYVHMYYTKAWMDELIPSCKMSLHIVLILPRSGQAMLHEDAGSYNALMCYFSLDRQI